MTFATYRMFLWSNFMWPCYLTFDRIVYIHTSSRAISMTLSCMSILVKGLRRFGVAMGRIFGHSIDLLRCHYNTLARVITPSTIMHAWDVTGCSGPWHLSHSDGTIHSASFLWVRRPRGQDIFRGQVYMVANNARWQYGTGQVTHC